MNQPIRQTRLSKNPGKYFQWCIQPFVMCLLPFVYFWLELSNLWIFLFLINSFWDILRFMSSSSCCNYFCTSLFCTFFFISLLILENCNNSLLLNSKMQIEQILWYIKHNILFNFQFQIIDLKKTSTQSMRILTARWPGLALV